MRIAVVSWCRPIRAPRGLAVAIALAGALVACGSSSSTPNDAGGTGDGAGGGTTTPNDGGSSNDATLIGNADGGGSDGSLSDSSTGGGDTGSGGNEDSSAGDDGATDATADAAFVEGPHPALPHVINNGGVVLTAPKIVTITYKGDTNQASFQSFGSSATNNTWWNTIRPGYCDVNGAGVPTTTCIGDGPAGTSIVLDTVPASPLADSSESQTESQLQDYIQSLIPGTIPQPDAETLLMFYFPSSMTITLDGLTSCTAFGGYHNAMTVGGVTFAYAILPECPVGTTGPTLLQYTTLAASHEIAEAATDPFSATYVGGTLSYYLDYNDAASWAWGDIVGGEVGDICFDYLGLGQDETTENGFMVQRIWSNAKAAAGHDPCVPEVTAAYFNVAPEQWLLTAAVGQTVTFTADAFSDGPTADWAVFGYDLNATQTNSSPYLSIEVKAPGGALGSSATVGNGDKVTVSVTLKQDPGALAQSAGGAAGLLISYDNLAKPTKGHYWPFVIATLADQVDAGFIGVDAAMGTPPRPTKVSRAQLQRLREFVRGPKSL